MLFYFTRYQSIFDKNIIIATWISKKFADLCLLLPSIFFQTSSIHSRVLSHFFEGICCKHILPISASRCYSLVPVISTAIIYEFLANMDHIENLMALSILRVTEDSSRIEMDME